MSSVSMENVTMKWYPEVRHYCPNTPILLVGTKKDLRNDMKAIEEQKRQGISPVTSSQGEELAKKLKAVGYIECSAFTGENLKSVFDTAVKTVLFKSKPKKQRCVVM